MADPVTAFTILSAGASVAKGVSERAAAMDESARLESEARLAETQALQRDTQARDELTRFLSSVRAARSANGLSASSPNARLLEADAITTSDDERLRTRADDRQRAANFRTAAASARRSGTFSLLTGAFGAAVPLRDYYSLKA